MKRSRVVSAFLMFTALVSASCGGGTSDSTNTTAQLVVAIFAGGSVQTAVVGQAVSTLPAVKVTKDGVAQAGVNVTFSVTAGAGTLAGASQTTNADGVARVGGWTLGNIAGANTVVANVSGAAGASVTFTATGLAAAAAALTKLAGDAVTSAAGLVVATKQSVKISDTFGNAVSGVPITFAVVSGGGVAAGATQNTGADGVATIGGWTLGNLAGANTLTATATGTAIVNNTVTFTATGVAGPVATLTKLAGDAQSATISALLAIAPSVRASDQFGNLVASQAVNFAVASGGGSVTGASQTTSALGVATVGGWTLGSVVGANSLTATASTVTVTFTATALAAFNAAQYVGTYNGTWTNTTFGSTGTGNAVVTNNAGASTASVTVNVTGNVLGTGGVTNSVSAGAYTGNGANFTGNVSPMGNIVATIAANGAITASGTGTPNASISRWDATGTLTATSLQMTFTVRFTDNSTAVGTISLTKP